MWETHAGYSEMWVVSGPLKQVEHDTEGYAEGISLQILNSRSGLIQNSAGRVEEGTGQHTTDKIKGKVGRAWHLNPTTAPKDR